MEQRLCIAAGIAAVLAGTAGAIAAPLPDPYAVFDRARHVLAAQQYPAYLSYTVAVDVTERGVPKSRHYHLVYDTLSGSIDVNPISDEEQAAPPTPSGFVLHLQPRRQNQVIYDRKVGNPGEALDFLGVPRVSPTYTFGLAPQAAAEDGSDDTALVSEIRKEFNDPVPLEKQREQVTDPSIKVIATVSSRTRDYVIRLADVEDVGGHACYHLQLQPTHDPQKLRLRDLWVDTQSYQPWQLVSAGNFTGTQVNWLITFAQIDGSTYITSETAQSPIGIGDHRYQTAKVAFEGIAATTRPQYTNYYVTGHSSPSK